MNGTVRIDPCRGVVLARLRIHSIRQQALQLDDLRRGNSHWIFQNPPMNAFDARRFRGRAFVAEVVMSAGFDVPVPD